MGLLKVLCIYVVTDCFFETPNSRSRCVSESFVCSWELLPCSASVKSCEGFCLVLPYFVLSCMGVVSWRPVLFCWSGSGGKGMQGSVGRVEGWETVVEMY